MNSPRKMKSHCFEDYKIERQQLTEQAIDTMLESGRRWNLAPTLAKGGVAIFPHTYLHVCAAQIAAVVQGALDSGADQVVAIGVLHSCSDEFVLARSKEKGHQSLADCSFRGVHGPNLSRGSYWKEEYSLLSFEFLWKEEVKRRGKKAPKLHFRYPYLVDRQPQNLPGIKELEALCKDACVVATSDLCHHGVAYGMTKESTKIGDEAFRFAKKNIETNLAIMAAGDYESYYEHCLAIRSDSFDVGTMLHYLRGALKPKLLDLVLGDVASIFFGNPSPSWVACSLVELSP